MLMLPYLGVFRVIFTLPWPLLKITWLGLTVPNELLRVTVPLKSVYSTPDTVTALIVIVNGTPAICSPMLSKAKAASGSFTVKLLLVPLTPSLLVAAMLPCPAYSG